mgnify:FL=1
MRKTKWPGNWKVACHRCGFWYPSSEIRKEWTGILACPSCFETRHPQTLIKIRPETAVPDFVSKEASPETFVALCDIMTSSGYADLAVADCAKADGTTYPYALLISLRGNGHT